MLFGFFFGLARETCRVDLRAAGLTGGALDGVETAHGRVVGQQQKPMSTSALAALKWM